MTGWSLPNIGALELDVSRSVLVIGRGKPHHITEDQAAKLVLKGEAIWQKSGRRIKYTKGKRSRPQVRDLSVFVDQDVLIALRDRSSQNHHFAKLFVNQTRRKRERIGA